MKRREFVDKTSKTAIALSVLGLIGCQNNKEPKKNKALEPLAQANSLFFKISLAQWSLHRTLHSGKMNHLDFASKARSFGCDGIEYVNQFFADKAKDKTYLKEMNNRANSEGVDNVLIMIDREGLLADSTTSNRLKAIENHYKWVDAAHVLGCHAIRVNLGGGIDKTEASKAGIDSLIKLSEFAKDSGINILVENHGGFSSDGNWLADVMKHVHYENCGTLPDFGNFCIKKDETGNCIEEYDRYQGVSELLPFAKALSAKSHNFDPEGNETVTDYLRMMKMAKASGYRGYVGIEFEGDNVSEEEGIRLTKDLLVKVGKKL